jgi:general secretion pathway protein J
MRTLGNTKTTIGKVTDRVDEVRVISEFLRTNLGSAIPVVRVGASSEFFTDGGNYSTYFAGNATGLMWVAPLLTGADMAGAYILYLALVDERLELKWHPYQMEADAVAWGVIEPRTLLESVEEFEVGYLAFYGGEWIDVWESAQRIPVAVRISIKSADRYWPELVVRLSGAEMNIR